MELSEIAMRLGVGDLMGKYQQYADTGRVDDLLELFAPDGVFETNGVRLTGRPEIGEWFRETINAVRQSDPVPGRHHLSTMLVTPKDAYSASTYATFAFIGTQGLDHWGTYKDEVVLSGAQWLFTVRRARVEGYVPGSPVERLFR
jgi:hypothetical protein